ncbi:MAG TPA: argininosuccinate lyase [Acidobacteriaceae bacterium]
MKMWSGRFREPLDPDFDQWQRSIPFDQALLLEETQASKAHALALLAAGILDPGEQQQIADALDAIAARFDPQAADFEPGLLEVSGAEDIHHFVELMLVERLGTLGFKLHTGRSRNEQIATDLRLYIRDRAASLAALLAGWAEQLLLQARAADDAVMPSYTHLQRAEPVLVAHWLLAYVEMSLRDVSRLHDAVARLNYCPLGSGAIAGATLPLDRHIAARALRFTAPTANSIDATGDRDFVLEYLYTLTLIGLHASRFAEEMILFATAEFGFVDLPEAFSTGSSAMPQKKNPDLAELIRAKVGRLSAAAHTVTLALKGLPLAYNKDLQETQEPVFAATRTTQTMLLLLARFTSAVRFRTAPMRAAAQSGYLNAMAAATYLVHKGLPFRTAHERVGAAVRLGLARGCELEQLPLAELQAIAPEFGPDIYDALTLEATLDCHDVFGGTARTQVRASLATAEARVAALLASTRRVTDKDVVHASP